LTVPGLFSTVGATFSAKQRKPMQEKPQQIGRCFASLKITVRNSEKLRKKPLLQLEIQLYPAELRAHLLGNQCKKLAR
jgi:hypothetical protein